MDERAELKAAMAHQVAGRFPQAELIYQRVLAANPDSHDALHLLGLIKAESDQDVLGIELIESAIQRKPTVAAFHHNLAGIYRRHGKLKEAEQSFREAIRLKPDYAEAYQGLAEMVKFEAGDPLLGQIEQQLAQPDLTTGQASYLHFAAGKVLDDQSAYAAAFAHYKSGNKAAQRQFNSAAFRQQTKDILYEFSPKQVRRLSAGSDSTQPFFVVGMPRSGTSLVEQILASHSSVFGAGELNDMKFIARDGAQLARSAAAYPGFMSKLSREHPSILAKRYLEQTSHPGAAHVVDKHPLNFVYVGLILLMFPNAKIIHTERHPLDTCLSCYFQNFTRGQDYSFDLETLADFYLDYQRLMAHWHQAFPGRVLDVSYEGLLANLEGETRRMLDFCELPFEQACLSFYNTDRAVKTASFRQVRQPIYQTSKHRWRHYAKELAPVARKLGLGAPADAPVTISSLGQLR